MMKKVAITLLVSISPVLANGEEFVCSFGSGVATELTDATWKNYERVNQSSPMMLTYAVFEESHLRQMLAGAKKRKDAAGIELASGLVKRAEATGYGGWVEGADGYAGPIMVVPGAESLTLTEMTATGNVTITTLFVKKKTIDGRIPAIHSRHMAMIGSALVSQYTGGCIRTTKRR